VAYTTTNFKTKKSLKEAIAAGQIVTWFQPGPFSGNPSAAGRTTIYLEGPHYPAAHTWYAQAEVDGDQVVKVK
jgi:hypothetical protein